jgi:hypothetical protein
VKNTVWFLIVSAPGGLPTRQNVSHSTSVARRILYQARRQLQLWIAAGALVPRFNERTTAPCSSSFGLESRPFAESTLGIVVLSSAEVRGTVVTICEPRTRIHRKKDHYHIDYGWFSSTNLSFRSRRARQARTTSGTADSAVSRHLSKSRSLTADRHDVERQPLAGEFEWLDRRRRRTPSADRITWLAANALALKRVARGFAFASTSSTTSVVDLRKCAAPPLADFVGLALLARLTSQRSFAGSRATRRN